MFDFAIKNEETRLDEVGTIMDYPEFKERHRVFPALFEGRNHKRILESSAGVGYAAKRILDNYPANLVCNEISPSCFKTLRKLKTSLVSFNLDQEHTAFPFSNNSFDAVISLVTIEHLLNIDHFISEIRRVLCDGGYLYIATPNYAAPEYLVAPLVFGRSFHNPLSKSSRYEFYGHVRYFTYVTLLEYVASFGFAPDTVYIARPSGSDRYRRLYLKSKLKANIFRFVMSLRHRIFSPRWASEPIVCFQKTDCKPSGRIRKTVL